MRMPGQASPSLTSRLVCELTTQGEEEREHAFDKRLAVATQLIVGRFVVKIDSDGPVFAGLAGRVAHGSSSGQMVGAAADPQWGKTCLMARRPRPRWALPLHPRAPCKRNGGMSQDPRGCRDALSPWSDALQTTLAGEQPAPARRHAEAASFPEGMLG